LVEEDHAADELLDALRREQHVAVGAAVLLGRLEPDRVEALLDRGVALVRGEDALSLGDERAGRGLQFSHRLPPAGLDRLAGATVPVPARPQTRPRSGRWRSTTRDGSRASRAPCPTPAGRRR